MKNDEQERSSSPDGNTSESKGSGRPFSIGLLSVIRSVSVEPALFLYMVSSFLQFPVFQTLIYEKSCLDVHSQNFVLCSNDSATHKDNAVQTEANFVFMLSSICLTIPTFIATIFLGSFGDRRSRKLAILAPYIGLAMADVNYIIQSTYLNWSVYYLLISDGLFGIFGGYSSIIGTSFSYGAQDSSNVGRSYRMAYLEGAIGAGGTIGYLFSGVILQATNYQTVFLINLILHCICFVYLLIRTTDTKEQIEKRRPKQGGVCVEHDVPPANGMGRPSTNGTDHETNNGHLYSCSWLFKYFRDAVSILRKRSGDHRLIIVVILVAFSISYLVFSGSQDIMFYYLKLELNWSTALYGLFRAIYYGSSSVMIFFLFPLLKYRGWSDWILAAIGILSRMIGSLMLCFPFSTWFVFCVSAFYMFNRFAATGMRAIASKQVEKDEQGKLFAAIALIEALCSLLASVIFNNLYSWTLSFYVGFSYALMAFLMLIPLVLVCYVGKRLRRSNDYSIEPSNVGRTENTDTIGSNDSTV